MTVATIEKRSRKAKASGNPLSLGMRMSEARFESWSNNDVRAEWVNGEVIVMSPANVDHIDLNIWLLRLLSDFVELKQLGRILGVEAQVRFSELTTRRNPDVLFVSRKRESIIKPTFIDGAPDLIMEIVSPDSASRDWREKFHEYQASGVREYWIIDLHSQRVEVNSLVKGKYRQLSQLDDQIKSKVLRGLYVRPSWLWKHPLPRVGACLKDMGIRL